jgi:hypothetical protein
LERPADPALRRRARPRARPARELTTTTKGATTTTISTTLCQHCGDELEGNELTLCRECKYEADGLCRWCGERPQADGEVCDPCAERSALAIDTGSFD